LLTADVQVVSEIAPLLPPGSVHVGCSTISPQAARAVQAAHAEHGSEYVSAPVFARPDVRGTAAATDASPSLFG
jgi:3-hydroxyisobutyrate dehydrogenase-like beta-hydroxyacid dehydrogenase